MTDEDLHGHGAGQAEREDALFVNLILIFQGAAMQQMGKIINPLTGKVERNLDQARFSIDTLAMLKEKTRGNISADLERLLESTLLNLRMNFVEESAKGPETSESGPEEASSERPGAASGDEAQPDAEISKAAGTGKPAGPKAQRSRKAGPRRGKA